MDIVGDDEVMDSGQLGCGLAVTVYQAPVAVPGHGLNAQVPLAAIQRVL